MMNSIETQPIPAVSAPLPKVESPQFALDPTNPLVWILVITMLLGNADEVIRAIAELIQAIASFNRRNSKRSNSKRKERNG